MAIQSASWPGSSSPGAIRVSRRLYRSKIIARQPLQGVHRLEVRRGDSSQGLRILRARAEDGRLTLVLEGRAGRSYAVGVRGPRRPDAAPGVTVAAAPNGDARLLVSFEGPEGAYVRRELSLPLR